jgi:23S rRNA (cytidine1920-2'-O)/16S rRNA (cytidine1409-2'-O)-methyltransferase
VFAVDVGYGQLAWSLRNDPRVIVIERTNIRHMAW